MKRLAALLALTGAFAVAACDNPLPVNEDSLADKAAEQPLEPVAEAPPPEPVAPPPPPADSNTIPPEQRTSEQSVQPESETLFY